MDSLLRLQNFSFGITPQKLLISGLSLQLAPHSVMFISGANGMGKSTLLKILAKNAKLFL